MGDASTPTASSQTYPAPIRAGLPSAHPTESFWQTSHPNPLSNYRSTPTLPSQVDIVVIGTGISGAFIVDELLTHLSSSSSPVGVEIGTDSDQPQTKIETLQVLVLEARTLCSCATGRNGGHLQPLIHSAPSHIIDFELSNFHHVKSLIGDNGVECDFRVLPQGGCLGFWNKEIFEDAKRDLETSAGEHQELVRVVEDPKELKTLGLNGDVKGAIVQKLAASLSPYKLVVWLWGRILEQYGVGKTENGDAVGTKGTRLRANVTVNLQTTTPVTELKTHTSPAPYDYLLQTPRGQVTAKTVVFATNGYTSHLLSDFTPLIRPVQAQMSALVPPKDSRFGSEGKKLIPMSYGFMGIEDMDHVMSDYLVQNPFVPQQAHNEEADKDGKDGVNAGSLDKGGTRDVVGGGGHLMYGGGRHRASNHGEGCWSDDFVDKKVERHLRGLPQRLDLSSNPSSSDSSPPSSSNAEMLDIAASWTGIIGYSADGHPWIGAVPDKPGVFVCAGYTGHGMTNAPLCGRYVGRLVAGKVRKLRDEEDKREERQKDGPGTSEKERRKVAAVMEEKKETHMEIRLPEEYMITKERIEQTIGQQG